MHDDPVAALDGVGVADQVLSRDPLQHRRRSHLEGNAIGNGHELVPIGGDTLRVAAGDVHPSDPLARRRDGAGSLDADDRRWLGAIAAAFALVDVPEVDANRLHVDDRLALRRGGLGDVAELEHLGAAVACEHDGLHGGELSRRWPLT